MMHPFPSHPTSLRLAGPPGSVFTLWGTRSLACLPASSSSAFLLPFPLPPPLAGDGVERRSQGADPVAAGEGKKKKETQLDLEGLEDDR